MKTHDLTPNTPEWLAYRATMFNASDAPAMMGVSPYETRSQLLHRMHTGLSADVDAGTQGRFDDGHRFERLARPLAEQILGEDLYVVVGSKGRLSASFDGITLAEDINWEHKSINDALRAVLPAEGVGGPEVGDALPEVYRIQMEQHCMVSDAGRELFTASKWDAEDNLVEARHCWYEPDDVLRAEIIMGWAQFEKDLAAYKPPTAAAPAPVGKAPDTLPALRIEVQGMVTASNLAEFKQTALAAIRSVNRELRTDADFADADKAVKWCADVEARLKAAKEHALSQTASIDELFKALDDIAAESKAVRLDLSKLSERRKQEVKEQAVTAARAALDKHIAALNAELAPMRLQPVAADFAGAIRGLRTIASMQDKLDTALASGKIAADQQARLVRGNLATFKEQAAGLEALFADLGQLVHKAADDFAAVLDQRITKHRADEAEKARKAAEQQARLIAEAEQRAREQEAARIAEQQRQQAAAEAAAQAQAAAVLAAAAAPAPVAPLPVGQEPRPIEQPMPTHAAPQLVRASAAPAANEPATIKLGDLCARLGFTVTGRFVVDVLRVQPAEMVQGLPRWRESQFALICAALVRHIGDVQQLQAA